MITATITGNVGKVQELRTTGSGKSMLSFSVASTYKKQGQEEGQTTWVDVLCFDEQADMVAQTLQKGDRVVVTGRLALETYQKKDGTPGSSLRLMADEVGKSLRWAGKRQPVAAGVGRDVNDEDAVIPF
jgi:single-strand DNA-binding protein